MSAMARDESAQVTLLCSRFRPERYGGVEERLWHVATSLARRGRRVEVLTENRTGAPSEEIFEPGLHVFRFERFDPGRLWRWFHLAQVRWWYRTLKAHPPQGGVLWAADPMMATAAILAGYRRRLVFNPAACAAGMIHIGRLHEQVTTMQLPRSLVWIDRFAYARSPIVLVSSENVKQQFERFYGPHPGLHVCRYGIEVPDHLPDRVDARRRLGLAADAFVAGFIGRLDPCKGIEYLFEAARLMGLNADDRLLIIGDGSDEPRLREIAARLGIERHVVWLGRLDEPSAACPAMDVLVLPSLYEAFGLVLLEGMAAGLPVIGRAHDPQMSFTASREIISDGVTGFVTDAREPGSLAEKLGWLRAHPDERRAMGERARLQARARNWDALIEEYMAVVPDLRG